MNLLKMTDLDLNGKRVLIRQDLNVPIKNGEVTSDKRIVASLPTILYATKAGAKVMITSHLGRPNAGKFDLMRVKKKTTKGYQKKWPPFVTCVFKMHLELHIGPMLQPMV